MFYSGFYTLSFWFSCGAFWCFLFAGLLCLVGFVRLRLGCGGLRWLFAGFSFRLRVLWYRCRFVADLAIVLLLGLWICWLAFWWLTAR